MATISFGEKNYGLQMAENHGLIHTEIHPPLERPETPPSPLSTIPFPRDIEFVSRDELLRQMREKSSGAGSRIALVGLGGVGKSQLAIEHSYQIRCETPATWTFWVHASNEARFEQSFRDIADQLKLPGRGDPGVNILRSVENWLRDERNGRWICVLDNVDDEFLSLIPPARKENLSNGPANAPIKPLLEYVPRSPNGSTIVTTRNRSIALRLVNYQNLIEVEPMKTSEALDLFQKKLSRPELLEESQESQRLIEVLEFMPLAIVQAASYIRNCLPRCSIAQYLKYFQNDWEATKLLEKKDIHTFRDWEAKNSILETWQITFEYIRQVRPSATDLLSLMSFFDRQGIPENLVRQQLQHKATLYTDDWSNASLSSDEESLILDMNADFEQDVNTLRDFSFIFISGNNSFMMHRLVQLSTRAWLKSYGQEEKWRESFIRTLATEFPSGRYGTWEKCGVLYPHLKSALSQQPKSEKCLTELSGLLYRGAWYALGLGLFGDMEIMASKSKKQRVKLYGPESETALESKAILAIAYRKQGRWEEAEQLEIQVMETRKINFGVEHPDTLSSMANLASTYRKQGRWEEAAQLEMQVIETRKINLGEGHPDSDTPTSMANLASTYWNQGRWKEAEQLDLQVVEILKIKLGEDHPDTLTSMANLASTYSDQGRWEEAEQLFVRVMKTRETKLGKNHPSTLTSVNNLAVTFMKQGRWEEAEQLQVHVMETLKMKLSEKHPSTLTSMANLAFTWKYSGRNSEAIELLRTCLTKQEQIPGLNHPNTLSNSRRLLNWEMGALDVNDN